MASTESESDRIDEENDRLITERMIREGESQVSRYLLDISQTSSRYPDYILINVISGAPINQDRPGLPRVRGTVLVLPILNTLRIY